MLLVVRGRKTCRLARSGAASAAAGGSTSASECTFATPADDLFANDGGKRYVEVTLGVGDALLIPKKVWHAVRSVPGTLALSIQLSGLSKV